MGVSRRGKTNVFARDDAGAAFTENLQKNGAKFTIVVAVFLLAAL